MSKPLFKRPKKKKVFNKRKSYHDEGSEDEVIGTTAAEAPAAATSKDIENKAMTPSSTGTDIPNNVQSEESESEYSRIQIIKKTRKIKNQFRTRTQSKSKPKKMKLNPMQQKELEQEKKDAEEEEVNRDLKQRLEGNFAITGKSTADTDEDGNVLTKKHRLAMELYIQSQMQKQNPGASHGQGSNLLPLNEDGKEMEVKNTDDLYQRLLLESNELGTRDNNNNSNGNGNGEERSSIEIEQEDVGAGGAMLGGTGIAEVILPVDDKIRAARETEVAAAKLEKRRALYKLMHASNKDAIDVEVAHDQRQDEYVDLSQMLPMNFGSGPGKGRNNKSNGLQQQQLAPQRTRPKPPLIPSGAAMNKNSMSDIGSSYAHNFRLHNEEWITKKKQENALQIQEVVQPENEVDGSRVGFEAKRGLKAQKDGSSGGDGRKFQRAHDDMVYKKFVSREFHNNKK